MYLKNCSLIFCGMVSLITIAWTMERDIKENYIVVDDPIRLFCKHVRLCHEYNVNRLDNESLLTLWLPACDPVPLNTFGSLRYFFLSATSDNGFAHGVPIAVEDSDITNIIAVRGKSRCNKRITHAYLGYNKDDFDDSVADRRHKAIIFAATLKSFRGDSAESFTFNGAHKTESGELYKHVCSYLENNADHTWASPRFKNIMADLFDIGFNPVKSKIYSTLTSEDIVIRDDAFYSKTVYWTRKENKLKAKCYY